MPSENLPASIPVRERGPEVALAPVSPVIVTTEEGARFSVAVSVTVIVLVAPGWDCVSKCLMKRFSEILVGAEYSWYFIMPNLRLRAWSGKSRGKGLAPCERRRP
jgi:hypothetical protein